MSETEKELWKTLDLGVFGTNDPQEIRRKAKAAAAAWQEERSTLGGYLRSVRKMLERSACECAETVGVREATWRSWEADRVLPSCEEIEQIVERMEFGFKKRENLHRLRKEATRIYLKRMTEYRPHLQAARGVAGVDRLSEWSLLPQEVRDMVERWAGSKGHSSPEEVLDYLLTLEDEQGRRNWVDEVWQYA